MKMMRVRDVGRFIREQREAAQLSLRNLASLAGVSNPYLSQIERGLRRPSADILNAIAKALSISAETLYVKAGILEDREGADVSAALRADRSLTERQKAVLLQIYTSFKEDTERRRSRRRARTPADHDVAGGRSPSTDPSPHPAPLRSPAAQPPGGR